MAWTWRIDSETAGITALCMGDAAAMLSSTNPSMFTIRQFSLGSEGGMEGVAGDIRRGYLIGGALTLVIGFGGSAVSRSWWPVAGSVIALAVLIVAYEWAIQNPRGADEGATGGMDGAGRAAQDAGPA